MFVPYLLFIFFLSLTIFIFNLCPTVFWYDSAELTFTAYFLGNAHPPGYALYCLLGKLFSFLPIGNIAFRINFSSAIFASGAVSILGVIIYLLTKHKAISFFTVLIFLFSPQFFIQGQLAEKYTLDIFFLSLNILLSIYVLQKKDFRFFLFFVFISTFSITHHLTQIIFFLIAGFLFFKISFYKHHKNGLSAILFLILPLCIYVYHPLRTNFASFSPFWKANSLLKLLYLISGKGFQQNVFQESFLNMVLKKIPYFYNQFLQQFTLMGILLGITGIVYLLPKRNIYILLTFIMFILSLIFPLIYNVHNLQIFMLPSFFIFAIFLAQGILWTISILKKTNKFLFYSGNLIIFSSLFVSRLIFIPQFSLGNDKTAEIYAERILKTLPYKATLLNDMTPYNWYRFYPLWYENKIIKIRKDITLKNDFLLLKSLKKKNLKNTYLLNFMLAPLMQYNLNKENLVYKLQKIYIPKISTIQQNNAYFVKFKNSPLKLKKRKNIYKKFYPYLKSAIIYHKKIPFKFLADKSNYALIDGCLLKNKSTTIKLNPKKSNYLFFALDGCNLPNVYIKLAQLTVYYKDYSKEEFSVVSFKDVYPQNKLQSGFFLTKEFSVVKGINIYWLKLNKNKIPEKINIKFYKSREGLIFYPGQVTNYSEKIKIENTGFRIFAITQILEN